MLDKFTSWMEEHFVPAAAKIGSNKFLAAIRDAFIAIMPITMTGAIATLLNVFVRDLPTSYLPDLHIAEHMQWLITINGNVWWATLAMLSLAFVFALGYQISKMYRTDALAGGLISLASFIAVTPQVATLAEAGPEGADAVGWGFLNYSYLDARGLFTALLVGLLSSIVYAKLMNRKITIKMPDSVPPAVSKAFASIIPGVIAIYLCGAAAWIVSELTGGLAIGDVILKYVQMPFLGLSQGLGAVLIIVMAVQLLCFFGLHGTNVLGAVIDGTYLTALTMNDSLFQAGKLTASEKAAKAEFLAASNDYEQTVLNALAEVSSTLIQRDKLRSITATQSEAVEAYHTAVKLSFERYRTGLSNYIEVLYAQQNLYPAQIQLSQYYYQHASTLVSLYTALGGGWNMSHKAIMDGPSGR